MAPSIFVHLIECAIYSYVNICNLYLDMVLM